MIPSESLVSLIASSSQLPTPSLPGGIVAWIICYRRRREPIGGWLLFFFWQVYGSIFLTAVFLGMNIQNYVPENFGPKDHFAAMLVSVIPRFILLGAEAVVVTFLLSIRTWDLFILLRTIVAIDVAFLLFSVAIHRRYFPEGIALHTMALITQSVWLAYSLFSRRVGHVFRSHDWDTAADAFHGTSSLKIT